MLDREQKAAGKYFFSGSVPSPGLPLLLGSEAPLLALDQIAESAADPFSLTGSTRRVVSRSRYLDLFVNQRALNVPSVRS